MCTAQGRLRETYMGTILIVGLTMACTGRAGTSGASAAPVNATVIGDLATATDQVTPVGGAIGVEPVAAIISRHANAH
jgi:hypothetical protein